MTIIGIGTDIVEIERIKAIVSRSGDKLAHKILSFDEWQQYQKHNQQIRFLAKRFAMKEAASKALGTGIRNGLTFSQFKIYNDNYGKPYLLLCYKAKIIANRLGITNTHVTLADERHYAFATVIFER